MGSSLSDGRRHVVLSVRGDDGREANLTLSVEESKFCLTAHLANGTCLTHTSPGKSARSCVTCFVVPKNRFMAKVSNPAGVTTTSSGGDSGQESLVHPVPLEPIAALPGFGEPLAGQPPDEHFPEHLTLRDALAEERLDVGGAGPQELGQPRAVERGYLRHVLQPRQLAGYGLLPVIGFRRAAAPAR